MYTTKSVQRPSGGTFQSADIYSSAGEYDIVVTYQFGGNGDFSDGLVSVLLGNGETEAFNLR